MRDCRTVSSYESRVVGYDVVYEYHGQRYTTRTASDPGPRLAIDVRPAAAPAYDDGAARGGYARCRAGLRRASYEQAPAGRLSGAAGRPTTARPRRRCTPPRRRTTRPRPTTTARRATTAPPVVSIGFGSGYGWRHGYRHGD